jgi:8-oxo-dGTP diphosphatase
MNKIPIGLKRTATLCILRHQNQFLLLHRYKEPHKNNFTPVGGKLDPFESPLKSVIRETFEETGIKVKALKYCGILTETSPTEYNWTSYVYVADIHLIPPPVCNEGTLTWVSFDDLLHLPTPPTDWYIYKYLLKMKPFAFSAEYDEKLKIVSMTEEIENKVII